MLGADAGVVEAGRDRVGQGDLARVVLEHIRVGALEHARAGGEEPRGVVAENLAAAAGLDPAQGDARVGEEGVEDADGVGAAAHTGDHHVGQAALGGEHLLAGLAADHTLEVAHHGRVGVGAKGRAEQVVALGVGHPVAHRLVDGVFERARATVDPAHLGAEQAHAEDIGPLAGHVLGAHVDHALEAEQGADGGRGHAVLAGAGLGDDAAFAHAAGQQALAEGIVDLVGAGVGQVLAFEIDLCAAALLGEAGGEAQGRGPPGVGAVEVAELVPEGRVGAGLAVGRLEGGDRGHEGLGNVAPAVGAESTRSNPFRRLQHGGALSSYD